MSEYYVIEAPVLDEEEPKFRTRTNAARPQYYTPFAIRLPLIITVLCITLACLVILQVGLSTGIQSTSNSSSPPLSSTLHKRTENGTVLIAEHPGSYLPTPSTTKPIPDIGKVSRYTTTVEWNDWCSSCYLREPTTITKSGAIITTRPITFPSSHSITPITGTGANFQILPSSNPAYSTPAAAINSFKMVPTAQSTPTAGSYVTSVLISGSYSAVTVTGTPDTHSIVTSVLISGSYSVVTFARTPGSPLMVITTPPDTITNPNAITATGTVYATMSRVPAVTAVASVGQYIPLPPDVPLPAGYTIPIYFVATYLPTFIGVMLKVIWDIVYASAKLMEPFYQLSHPEGAPAAVALLSCYFQPSFSWDSLSVIVRHPEIFVAGVVYCLLSATIPFMSAASSMKVTQYCPWEDDPTSFVPCVAAWFLNPTAVRVLQSLLGLISVSILLYIILSWRRVSGIYSDPSSIASVASLMGNEEFRADLARIDPQASEKEMKNALLGQVYMLSYYKIAPNQYGYGIVRVKPPICAQASLDENSNRKSIGAQSPVRFKMLEDSLLTFLDIGLFTVVLYYYLDHEDDSFNRFFNSQTLAPRFILTLVATIIDILWQRVEKDIRIMQPYKRLAAEISSPPDNTILASRTTTPITSFCYAINQGDLFLALVSLVSVLSTLLLIAIPGVPFRESQLYISYKISVYLSIIILGLMVVTNVGVFIWRRGNPPLPRKPETLASIGTYLCSSRMVPELATMSTMGTRERNELIKRSGRRYWFGRGYGTDEQVRWMVDDEPGTKSTGRRSPEAQDRVLD